MIFNLLSYFLATVLLISAGMVIVVQNSIHSVLFLVLSFISAAGISFLLECEFLALLFIIIYVGAIAILFLFVVMMLDTKTETSSKNSLKYIPIGSFVGLVFLCEVLVIISDNFKPNPYKDSFLLNSYSNWYEEIDSLTEIEVIGQILYTHYVLQFLIVGLILFLAVIGAIILTSTFSVQNDRSQVAFKQLSRNYKNVLFY